MKTLESKVCLVTGGTSGIGKVTALALGVAGAKVVFSGRRDREGEDTANSIHQSGADCLFVKGISVARFWLGEREGAVKIFTSIRSKAVEFLAQQIYSKQKG